MFWLVKNPQVRGCVPSSLSCFFVTRSKVRSFFSFHSPRKEQVFTWLGGQKMHNESKSRFDHQQRADCAPPRSSICGLSLHQSDSLRWQDQEERECGPAAALIRGNLSGVQSAAALPCHFSQISGPPLYSFTSHSRTSAADGRAVGKQRARGKPWAALVRWDCIISNVTCPWTW